MLSERADSPIELEIEGLDFGASFVDLIYNRFPHGAVSIGASFIDDKGKRWIFGSKFNTLTNTDSNLSHVLN